MRCTLKDTTQRYKSLSGFSIYLTVRYKAAPFDMLLAPLAAGKICQKR